MHFAHFAFVTASRAPVEPDHEPRADRGPTCSHLRAIFFVWWFSLVSLVSSSLLRRRRSIKWGAAGIPAQMLGPDGRVRLGDLFLVTEEQVDKAFLGDNNQYVGRTAWLGDALLHSDLSVVLYKSHPAGTKGSLSKMRQTLEANATMKVFLLEGTDAASPHPKPFGHSRHRVSIWMLVLRRWSSRAATLNLPDC